MQVINKNLSNEPDSFKAWKVKHPNAPLALWYLKKSEPTAK